MSRREPIWRQPSDRRAVARIMARLWRVYGRILSDLEDDVGSDRPARRFPRRRKD